MLSKDGCFIFLLGRKKALLTIDVEKKRKGNKIALRGKDEG